MKICRIILFLIVLGPLAIFASEPSPTDLFRLNDPQCTPTDIRVFKSAIEVIFAENIPCLKKVNPSIAAAFINKIRSNNTLLACAEGVDRMTGPVKAATQDPNNDPSTPILFFATPAYLMEPYSWDNSPPISEETAVRQTASTLFHELFHVLHIRHRSVNGKFRDSVFGFQLLCGATFLPNMFVDRQGSCQAAIFEDLNGNFKLENKTILENRTQELCRFDD